MNQSKCSSEFFTTQIVASILLFLVFLFLADACLQAQQKLSVAEENAVSTELPGAPPASEKRIVQREPLTFRDRIREYRQSTFEPVALVFPAIAAGYEQLGNYPAEWQQGGEGYGKRLASAYGGAVIDNTISFGVAALDREILPYEPSSYPKKAILRRAGYAIGHAFVSHKEYGGRTFAWSRVAGACGAGFVANEWYPDRHSNLHNAAYLATFNFASDIGVNLLKEFIRPQFILGPKKSKKAQPQESGAAGAS